MPHEEGLLVKGLKVFYGAVPAVRGVGLACRPGQVVGMIGPNGAGKSSFLSGVAGLIPATGAVHLDGDDISRWPAYRRGQAGIVYVAERRRVFPSLSLRENLLVSGWGLDRAELDGRVEQVFELFPRLKEREKVPPVKLSGGEQRMLSIGRALVTGARCILFDELSLGLAPLVVKTLAGTVRQLADEGRMVVLVEQYLGVLLEVADEVHVLERGRTVFAGEPEETAGWLREKGYLEAAEEPERPSAGRATERTSR
jgi:branched-chain amino acid transport system ATP-binding protein